MVCTVRSEISVPARCIAPLVALAAVVGTMPALAQTPQKNPAVVPFAGAAPVATHATQPGASADLGHAAGQPNPKDAVAAKAGVTQSQWAPDEIKAAQHACVALLKNLDLVAVGAAPVRDGDCGAPAPIELISVGKSPQVTFSPPVVVTCDMAAALHKWVTTDLQGLARKNLGAPLIRIETMSSYSCRNAYGRARGKLSEHGKANAIDIRAFLTAKAEPADVLAHWGPTERDIAAQIATAKAAAEKQKSQMAQPSPAPSQQPGQPTLAGSNPSAARASSDAVAEGARPSVVIGIPGASQPFPETAPSAIGLSNGLPTLSRLGGPKPQDVPLRGTVAIDQIDGRMKFLKGAHTSACKVFGTVLGPEANNAHRNHFHVDMAKRTTTSFCE